MSSLSANMLKLKRKISQKKRTSKKVSVALIKNKHGKYLMGRRRDSGKWTFAGGIVEGNETPLKTVVREVHEEVGILVPPHLYKKLGEHKTVSKYIVTVFALDYNEALDVPSYVSDIDQEFSEVEWVWNPLVMDLHIPKSENVVLQYLPEKSDKGSIADLDSATDNLLYQIKNEQKALAKRKLIKSFSTLSALKKRKVISEHNKLKEPAQQSKEEPNTEKPSNSLTVEKLLADAKAILDLGENITLNKLDYFSKKVSVEGVEAKQSVELHIEQLIQQGNEGAVAIGKQGEDLLTVISVSLDSLGLDPANMDDAEFDSAKDETIKELMRKAFLNSATTAEAEKKRTNALVSLNKLTKTDLSIRSLFERIINSLKVG